MKQLNIRVSDEQYAVLQGIVKGQEFKTTAQAVATSLMHKILDARLVADRKTKRKPRAYPV